MKRSYVSVGNRKKKIKLVVAIFIVFAVTTIIVAAHFFARNQQSDLIDLSYAGKISVEVNNNNPVFTKEDLKKAKKGFESYSKLDSLGRCGTAEASICVGTMPAAGENRGSMGSVTPSGWQSISFWCRCHLIGWQLSAENDNDRNLITGTTRMNMSGMLPYENKVAKYIEENPSNHVLYRVEPLYDGKNLVASGVNMQAESVEDKGKGLSFNVYVFNYQPGYIINYKNGMVDDDPDHQTSITISDKKAAYTGEPILIDDAKVEGSTGEVKYIYYTDKNAKERTTESDGSLSKGSAPSRKGKYYVRAVVTGDNWYPTAASNVAKLTIY